MTTGVFRAADRAFRPWKNGGGTTAEIIASPPGASLDNFEWRISTAIVSASGPFSSFPGVDRVLTILEGGGMILSVGGTQTRLDTLSESFHFSGDVPVAARVEGEPLLDFNVMVRRPFQAEVVRGPFAVRRADAGTRAHFALLLENRAGLARLDLVDLAAVNRSLIVSLVGAQVLEVCIK